MNRPQAETRPGTPNVASVVVTLSFLGRAFAALFTQAMCARRLAHFGLWRRDKHNDYHESRTLEHRDERGGLQRSPRLRSDMARHVGTSVELGLQQIRACSNCRHPAPPTGSRHRSCTSSRPVGLDLIANPSEGSGRAASRSGWHQTRLNRTTKPTQQHVAIET